MLTNISRSWTALANQLESLAGIIKAEGIDSRLVVSKLDVELAGSSTDPPSLRHEASFAAFLT